MRKVELFGPAFPDVGRLIADTGLDAGTVTALLDELAHVLKTSTRLGYVVDLALSDEDWEHLDDEEWAASKPRRLFGHANALELNGDSFDYTVDLVEAAIAVGERTEYEFAVIERLVTSVASQIAEIDDGETSITIATRRLGPRGREEDIENEIEEDPDVLAFHGYHVVTMHRQPWFGSAGTGDLLCELDDDSLLVVELKRDAIIAELDLAQIRRYMDHVSETNPGRRVRGLLIGDGIDWLGTLTDWPDPEWPEDVSALSARHLDLPSCAAQRVLWWQRRPAESFTPDAVVAVAADGTCPVRVWDTPDRPSPLDEVRRLGNLLLVDGWSCPVPLTWDRDPATWRVQDIEALVRARIAAEGPDD